MSQFIEGRFKIRGGTPYRHLHLAPSLEEGSPRVLALGSAPHFSGDDLTEHRKMSGLSALMGYFYV